MPELRVLKVRVSHPMHIPCRMGFAADGEKDWLGWMADEHGRKWEGKDGMEAERTFAARAGLVVPEEVEMGRELEGLWRESKGMGLEWRIVKRKKEWK